MSELYDKTYNPDVLSCLANLSNDEVFTPPEVANQMLDMLPKEIWSDSNATFLDPACKSGVFLREIAKRLIKGLEDEILDLDERLEHIFRNQLHGVAITELTSLLSRRSLYCSKYPNSKYSVVEFDSAEGNIRFRRCNHIWVNHRCKHCGASQEEYDRGDRLETHAYEFIHQEDPRGMFPMKFDVVVGNPPYMLGDGSGASTDAAAPIYQKFVEQAKKLNPRYLTMIIPSRWMVGGRSVLNQFRESMREDTRISRLFDYEDASSCFPGVHIDGGVCYFLWNRDYNGPVDYHYITALGNELVSKRSLATNTKYIIRDSRLFSVLDKLGNFTPFSEIVSKTKPFGIRKYLFNEPSRYPASKLSEQPFDGSVKIYGVKGVKGGAKRKVGYITRETVAAGEADIDAFKLFFTTSYSTNAVVPPEIIKGYPGEVCTETFLEVGPFASEEEMLNCKAYMETNLFRFLLFFGKGTMQVNQSVFDYYSTNRF